ncbi:MAG: hypothetical protein SF187_10670 [Deltaproteobacteria bacterium]|nr:hypothetical protein [Deltaproteobacteria bacterium]
MKTPLIFSLLASATLVAACGEPSDKPTEVKDLRVLAVAAEPPEVLFDRTAGWSAPQVTFTALVDDPRGGAPATFAWRFCPVDSAEACTNFPALRDQAPQPLRPMLDALFAQAMTGTSTPAADKGIGAQDVAPFASAWPAELFTYHLDASAMGLGNGAWPSAVLTVNAGPQTVTVQKRVTLNALDLSQWNPELSTTFGFRVCEANAPVPGCLAVRPRTPNQNPQITSVSVARGSTAGLPFAPVDGALVMRAKEKVRLLPTLSEGAFEPYQSIESALQDSRLEIIETKEQPVVSWFATAGALGSDRTAAALTKTFDNVFTAPDVPPAATGGMVSLWMVVRDLRGGTGWRQMSIQVLP